MAFLASSALRFFGASGIPPAAPTSQTRRFTSHCCRISELSALPRSVTYRFGNSVLGVLGGDPFNPSPARRSQPSMALGKWGQVDARSHAQAMVEQLFEAELDALRGLADGESVTALARRRSLSEVEAADIRESMMWKLGALSNADAVRIWLTAEI